MVDPALVKKIEGAPFQYGDRVKAKHGRYARIVGTVVSFAYDCNNSIADPHIMVSYGGDVDFFWKEELEAADGNN